MQTKMILDTAWRWDLTLRVTNMIGSNKICHIPFIVCHLGLSQFARGTTLAADAASWPKRSPAAVKREG